jgi:hypothetical protein
MTCPKCLKFTRTLHNGLCCDCINYKISEERNKYIEMLSLGDTGHPCEEVEKTDTDNIGKI